MKNLIPLVVFNLDEQRYALPYTMVTRIIQLVEISPLPNAPEDILGFINVQGQFVPIINIRTRLELPHSDIQLQDLIIITSHDQNLGFIVNEANFLEFSKNKFISSERILQSSPFIDKIIKDSEGPIHLLNLHKLTIPDFEEIESLIQEPRSLTQFQEISDQNQTQKRQGS